MPANVTRLGPGTLTLGGTDTPMDFSCQLANGVISPDKDKGDDKRALCGDTIAGKLTYTYAFSGTFYQDLGEPDGLFFWCWEHRGTEQPFEYVPNTDAGATATGTLLIDPLDFGSDDDYGEVMESDFEMDLVGEPVYTPGEVVVP